MEERTRVVPDTRHKTNGWQAICGRIDELRREGLLEQQQNWLAQVLRDGSDWRPRHAVLECAPEIRNPSKNLMLAICRVAANPNCECGTRLLACDAAECLLRRGGSLGGSPGSGQIVFQEARRMLRATQPPVLRQAVEDLLKLEPAVTHPLSIRSA